MGKTAIGEILIPAACRCPQPRAKNTPCSLYLKILSLTKNFASCVASEPSRGLVVYAERYKTLTDPRVFVFDVASQVPAILQLNLRYALPKSRQWVCCPFAVVVLISGLKPGRVGNFEV